MEPITLSNGVRILLESIPFFKTASFGIWVLNGSRHEKAEEAGASHFLEHMMFKGTASRSALDIAIQSDLLGGQLNAYTSKEYTCYYAHTLSDHAPTAFEMLCDMLTGPRMDREDVELERGVIDLLLSHHLLYRCGGVSGGRRHRHAVQRIPHAGH